MNMPNRPDDEIPKSKRRSKPDTVDDVVKIKDIDGPIQLYWLRGKQQDAKDLAGAVLYWRRIAASEREKREQLQRQVDAMTSTDVPG